MILLQAAKDTVFIQLTGAPTASWIPLITTALSSLVGALIGGAVTIWYKSHEIEIQKKSLDETIENNENKLKLELIKVRDLRNEYELSLKKFDFDRFDKVLSFAQNAGNSSHLDKVNALKDFSVFLQTINKYKPPAAHFEDIDEYMLWAAGNIYHYQNRIKEMIDTFQSNYSHAYPTVTIRLAEIKKELETITYSIADVHSIKSGIKANSKALFELREGLEKIFVEMRNDFRELEQIKRDFIRSTAEL